MSRSAHPALHRFALLTAVATLSLVGLGGLVTSHGAGMAVPDWPNTYGYNMFFFPVSKWVGGILYEHTHRLMASAVGLMTCVLAVWLFGRRARPFLRWAGLGLVLGGLGECFVSAARCADGLVMAGTGAAALGASFVWPRCEASPRGLRRLGLAAVVAVVLQGVLGGLRVVLYKDQLGIVHAALAQLFFVLVCALALFTSRWWVEGQGARTEARESDERPPGKLRWALLGTTLLIFSQLLLGATMRHQHAGLAIPDFPLAYQKLWPAMDSSAIERYNQHRMEATGVNPITAFQIVLQMAHRILALGILAAVAACAGSARRHLGAKNIISKLALGWLGLILAQALLGAATIWSQKAADIATAHVVAGAASLALGGLLCLVSFRGWILGHWLAEPTLPPDLVTAPLGARPATAGGLD